MIFIRDVFKEQLVQKKLGNSAFLGRLGIVLGALFLTFVLLIVIIIIPWLQIIMPVILFIILFLGYRLFKNISVEFEYAITNSELDIDIIYGKAKRKRIFEGNLRDIEAFRPLGSDEFQHSFNASQSSLQCISHKEAAAYEFLILYKGKKVRIAIEPNAEMLEHIRQYLKRGVYKL